MIMLVKVYAIVCVVFLSRLSTSLPIKNGLAKFKYVRVGDMMVERTFIARFSSHIDDDDNEQGLHAPRLWPFGQVYYEISPYLNRHKALIEKAMKHISDKSLYISFYERRHNDQNYVYITDDQSDKCASYVGMKGKRQELYLGQGCLNMGDILHELMHVLGFYHEHNRWDRDDYLKVHYENIIKDKQINFVKLSREQYDKPSEFDYDSIMIYDDYAFSANLKPTMTPTSDRHTIRNPSSKKSLSSDDINSLRELYN